MQTSIAPINESELDRLKAYMKYTHTLNLRVSWPVETAVFQSLAPVALKTPLAPRLRSIYGNCSWYNMHHAMLLLGSPALRIVNIDLSHLYHLLGRRMPYALSQLCAVAPNVEQLMARSHPYVQFSWTALLGLKNLRVLDFSAMYGSILDHLELFPVLARLERLEEVTFTDEAHTRTRPHAKCHLPRCAGFQKLQKMTVIGGAWIVPLLFAGLPNLRLKELHLVGLKHGFLPPFDEIVQSCSGALRNSLEILHLDYVLRYHFLVGVALAGPPLAPREIMKDIFPFFAFANIKEFSFSSQGLCMIKDDDLVQIGIRWPKLASLRFKCTAPVRLFTPVAPTVFGIASLARSCPNLRSVGLPYIVPLHGADLIEPPYIVTRYRWIPLCANLPGPGDTVEPIDVDRLVEIMWPLFGVVYHSALKADSHPLYEQWDAVLSKVAHIQTALINSG